MATIAVRTATIALLLGLAAGLSACVESRIHLSDDFGRALNQDKAAQVADPDAKYKGDPAPGSNGDRVALAQDRYVTGKVLQPARVTSTTIGTTVNGGSQGSSSPPPQ
jgi:hypothetical protein